ncbi:RCC1/BLIP-II [Sodiomyces alkalinus F11]|uniref:RCC1/BLIP-II n=1 Tax=Sodiomyces alkalinus (strain CBS 110278 / VKM F-3762 / F11) TaxID=1314773 RepID=A0A3N2Q742_SODAK|nr:RCC1/BLIP-II [Sodiomyces alkalinus F11]ROT42570.1 RCC1/BLIP-II [Sodiomyces alkalinus F11]
MPSRVSKTATAESKSKKTTTAAGKKTTAKAATAKTSKTATKKAEPATQKQTAKETTTSTAAAAAASKKRKAEYEPSDTPEEDVPKVKKSRTATAPKKAVAKAVPKKATGAAKRQATVEPAETKVNERKKRAATPAEKKPAKAPKVPKKTPGPKEPEPKPHPHQVGPKINDAPATILDVYVFGEGSSGELGLGSQRIDGKKPVDVKRPRLNPNLSAASVGVVQVACGGMHVAVLTKDNTIITWGVNDQGALGRDTKWDGGLRDLDQASDSGSDDDDDDDDSGLNPLESTPTAVSAEHFAPDAKFVQLVASDSATFALTEDGRVYGWGTFRSSDGILGFSPTIKVQYTPHFMPDLKNIKTLASGSNHVLALDTKGNIFAWGCGQQNQLGRRIIERKKLTSLIPQSIGLAKKSIEKIACGQYHSFAIDTGGKVWAWGLNNFAETGIRDGAGEDDAIILRPTVVEALSDHKIIDIDGGQHHSLACSQDGTLLTWGRFDGHQVGLSEKEVDDDDLIRDDNNTARILAVPTVVKAVQNVSRVAAGTDNNFAVTSDGKAYSWGFSINYQTGQGTIDDIKVPTLIDNTAIRGKKIVAAGAGGQFSLLVGEANASLTNGVNGH